MSNDTSSTAPNALHVIAPGPMAGPERVVVAGLRALAHRTRPIVAVLEDARAADDAADFAAACEPYAAVYRVAMRSALDPGAVGSLRNVRLLESPDVVHVHGYKALAYGLASAGDLPVLATVHGETHATAAVRRYELIARHAYAACSRVFLVDEAMRSKLRAAGVHDDRMQHLGNPLTRGVPRRIERHAGSPIRLLSLGRLSPEKGVRDLLSALSSCVDVRWVLDVVGDGPERDRLETFALRRGLGDRVWFHGFRSDIETFLSSADALVMLSHREGMPLPAIEAACTGIPMILSEVGALPALFGEHPAATLVPPHDEAAFVSAIRVLDNTVAEQRQAAEQAASAWSARFSLDSWAERTLSAYSACMAASGSTLTRRLAATPLRPFVSLLPAAPRSAT